MEEIKAREEEEDRIRVEKLKAKREREAKETEERRVKTEALFRGMSEANEKAKGAAGSMASFEDIMQE